MTGIIQITNPNFIEIIAGLMHEKFNTDFLLSMRALEKRLKSIISILREDISVFVESDYVDKVYRDSYYNYFASKADCLSRNCIRLSLLDNSSEEYSERKDIDYELYESVTRDYLGFIIIRPTIHAVIGRSAISPSALQTRDFKCCLAPISSTVNGFKVKVDAFPFSSQDAETMTCAETTLWSLMEYYGNKYAEYTPVRPSEILKNLESNIACRQLPSNGLSVENVTFALKTFGFGPQLYACSSFGTESSQILSCYVESGIPVVVALSNSEEKEPVTNLPVEPKVNHAVLCVGHEDISQDNINAALNLKTKRLSTIYGTVNVLDYDNIDKRFVFVDDNCPPYQKDLLATPANRYEQSYWRACRVSNFVAPLYKRIYMEPFVAKEYATKILKSHIYSHLKDMTVVMRTYLCSTRSFRHFVNISGMTSKMKDVISGVFMPKFVWITEVSKVDSFKRGYVDDLIVIDATSCETSNYNPWLVAFADQACYRRNPLTRVLDKCDIQTKSYESYSNLK